MRWVLLLTGAYAGWLALLAVQEFGHVLHAWLSGVRVERVVIPLMGFSRTDLLGATTTRFIVWGGPAWGCAIPLVALAIGWTRPRIRRILLAFSGLCLIANGAYLGAGSFLAAGDAGDLLRLGTPGWTLWLFGAITVSAGLYCWHLLGPQLGLSSRGDDPRARASD